MRPKVDFPAPRRPIKAMRSLRWPKAGPPPKSLDRAKRACCISSCVRPCRILRIISQSGELVVSSPSSSASEQSSARATFCNTRMETLPMPDSRFARCRSETSAFCASTRRGMPRRARSNFTRTPRSARRGFFSGTVSLCPASFFIGIAYHSRAGLKRGLPRMREADAPRLRAAGLPPRHHNAPLSVYPLSAISWRMTNPNDPVGWHGTTILCVRRDGSVTMAGDGQVSLGNTVVKGNARKVRRIGNGSVIAGFAGATADAFTLLERLEAKLERFPNQLERACVELAKDWRMDRYLRRLEAMLIVADKDHGYTLTGNGDVLEPSDGIVAIGSGGNFALSAARALMTVPGLTSEDIARRAMKIAADICIYTNENLIVETL